MDQAVNRRSHGVFENTFPFRERQIAGDEHAAAFVSFGKEGKQDFHLFPALLYIPEIITKC